MMSLVLRMAASYAHLCIKNSHDSNNGALDSKCIISDHLIFTINTILTHSNYLDVIKKNHNTILCYSMYLKVFTNLQLQHVMFNYLSTNRNMAFLNRRCVPMQCTEENKIGCNGFLSNAFHYFLT